MFTSRSTTGTWKSPQRSAFNTPPAGGVRRARSSERSFQVSLWTAAEATRKGISGQVLPGSKRVLHGQRFRRCGENSVTRARQRPSWPRARLVSTKTPSPNSWGQTDGPLHSSRRGDRAFVAALRSLVRPRRLLLHAVPCGVGFLPRTLALGQPRPRFPTTTPARLRGLPERCWDRCGAAPGLAPPRPRGRGRSILRTGQPTAAVRLLLRAPLPLHPPARPPGVGSRGGPRRSLILLHAPSNRLPTVLRLRLGDRSGQFPAPYLPYRSPLGLSPSKPPTPQRLSLLDCKQACNQS